jgi:hypothetical protein
MARDGALLGSGALELEIGTTGVLGKKLYISLKLDGGHGDFEAEALLTNGYTR